MSKLFSVIIPHRGSSALLQRAVASVPEGAEILVQEDPEGRGAGWARNQALRRACGKWVVFLDSDDYFTPEALALLEKHAHDPADVVYFAVRSVLSDSGEKSSRQDAKLHFLEHYANRPRELDFYLRYLYNEPWGKMVRRELIDREGILFDETSCANDYTFSVLCGLKAGTVAYDPGVLCVITEREGSVSHRYFDRPEKVQDRLKVYWKVQGLFDAAGIPLYPFYGLWMMCWKEGAGKESEAFRKASGISRLTICLGCLKRIIRKRLHIGVPYN